MAHEAEYHDNMIKMLELIWGDGYMAPGGTGNIAKLLDGIDCDGLRILDIGSGLGGPALDMVRLHGANVVGIDLESQLVEIANRAAASADLADRATFRTVEPGPLPFEDESFDVVLSSGALTQSPNKGEIFNECFRILRPGGHLRCYDWLRIDEPYSEDMLYWFKMEGLTFAMETLEQYDQRFRDSGFVDVEAIDASDWYRVESRNEYERIKGELYDQMVGLLGQESADHFVENWRALVVVCESGEMRQAYCRGQKPR